MGQAGQERPVFVLTTEPGGVLRSARLRKGGPACVSAPASHSIAHHSSAVKRLIKRAAAALILLETQ